MHGPSVLLAMTLLLAVQDRATPARAAIADLGWLAGDWGGTMGRATIEELRDDIAPLPPGWSTSPSRTDGRRPSSC